MPEIRFERFERDTPYNKERRANGDLRSLINDFRVIIDGEFRALLRRKVWGRGYFLTDVDERDIARPYPKSYGGSHPVQVESQAEFKKSVLAALTEGLIPDAQTLEEIRAAAAAKRRQEEEEKRAEERGNRLREAGPHMYVLLRQLQKSKPAGVEIAGLDALIHYIDYNKGELHDPELD